MEPHHHPTQLEHFPKHPSTHTHLLGPGEDDVLLDEICIVQVLEDDGDTGEQLALMELHQALEAPQQVFLGLLIVVAELQENSGGVMEDKETRGKMSHIRVSLA